MSSELASGASLENAFDETMRDFKLVLENVLTTAPVNTLKWWVNDWEPWRHVHLRLGKDIPVTAYDSSDFA